MGKGLHCGDVVQMVRMPVCHAGGRRFDPGHSRQQFGAVVQTVRMLACHARGRRFDPGQLRQF